MQVHRSRKGAYRLHLRRSLRIIGVLVWVVFTGKSTIRGGDLGAGSTGGNLECIVQVEGGSGRHLANGWYVRCGE